MTTSPTTFRTQTVAPTGTIPPPPPPSSPDSTQPLTEKEQPTIGLRPEQANIIADIVRRGNEAKKAQEKAAKEQARGLTAAQREAERLEQQAERDRLLRSKQRQQQFERIANAAANATRNTINDTAFRVQGLPVPGSIALPFLLLLLLWIVLIPVNGHTRLMWLWLTMLNQAAISPVIGASGNFGPPVPSGGTGGIGSGPEAPQSTGQSYGNVAAYTPYTGYSIDFTEMDEW